MNKNNPEKNRNVFWLMLCIQLVKIRLLLLSYTSNETNPIKLLYDYCLKTCRSKFEQHSIRSETLSIESSFKHGTHRQKTMLSIKILINSIC